MAGRKKGKGLTVIQLNMQNIRVGEYPNLRIAAESTQIKLSNIHSVITGRTATAGGYKWRYANRVTPQKEFKAWGSDYVVKATIIRFHLASKCRYTETAKKFNVSAAFVRSLIIDHWQSIRSLEAITREETTAIAA